MKCKQKKKKNLNKNVTTNKKPKTIVKQDMKTNIQVQ